MKEKESVVVREELWPERRKGIKERRERVEEKKDKKFVVE